MTLGEPGRKMASTEERQGTGFGWEVPSKWNLLPSPQQVVYVSVELCRKRSPRALERWLSS